MLTAAASASTFWSYLGYVAFAGAVFFVLLGARARQARSDRIDSIAELTGRLNANQDEIRELREKNTTQAALIKSSDQQVADLRASVRTLERAVGSHDLIVQQTKILTAGFVALGVDPKKLQVANGSSS